MLSKSRGQVLRLAAVLHLLFSVGSDAPTSDVISDPAIKAAINFIGVSCQQTAFISGRGIIEEDIQKFKSGE